VASGQEKLTTFILVRHAEKINDGTKDPELSDAGRDRALQNASIHEIYSTSFKRTRHTVEPIAQAKSIELKNYEAGNLDEIEKMLSAHAGKTILVCATRTLFPKSQII
jgi:broad specificity phosphatase PhoE